MKIPPGVWWLTTSTTGVVHAYQQPSLDPNWRTSECGRSIAGWAKDPDDLTDTTLIECRICRYRVENDRQPTGLKREDWWPAGAVEYPRPRR